MEEEDKKIKELSKLFKNNEKAREELTEYKKIIMKETIEKMFEELESEWKSFKKRWEIS